MKNIHVDKLIAFLAMCNAEIRQIKGIREFQRKPLKRSDISAAVDNNAKLFDSHLDDDQAIELRDEVEAVLVASHM